jgi:predicted ferric reductase
MRVEKLQELIIYYTYNWDENKTCHNLLNSIDKLQSLVIKIKDIYWQKPGVTSHVQK